MNVLTEEILATIQNMVKDPGVIEYNPLFIYGADGKAHLMQAIGNELHEKNPHLVICRVTTEALLNEYAEVLKNRQIASFRKKYRSVDVLMIDDIHFLQNNMRFQEEFFNVLQELIRNQNSVGEGDGYDGAGWVSQLNADGSPAWMA